MKIKHFKYLNEKGMSDSVMFDIVKYMVIPSLNISFEEVIVSTIASVSVRKELRYPLWELYLNVLILKFNIPENDIENAVREGIRKWNEEVQKSFEKFIKKYQNLEQKRNKKAPRRGELFFVL